MIDLHSHIIPNIDDGSRSLDETISLCLQSVDAGVTHMLCTPHMHFGKFDYFIDDIAHAFNLMVSEVKERNINLKLAFAAEVRISHEILALQQEGKLPYIGLYNNKAALLLELPHSHIPPGADKLIKWLLNKNVQPVIPHPERNREILTNFKKLLWLKQIGCVFQITAGSLTGRFKQEPYEMAWRMLDQNLVEYVASDLHSINRRPNDMGDAYKLVESNLSASLARKLFLESPGKITSDIKWQ
ncbi:tyrosine-protein phosphatase [Agaribacter flavus]|uniref:protein-tyrosine-phosphatase n=1 Tax=Agaribacter flavus TaxID=1902781 RepID=A0ABV7FNF1_9ALTE